MYKLDAAEATKRHREAYHLGVMKAFEFLSQGKAVPWRDGQVNNLEKFHADSAVRKFFKKLYQEERNKAGVTIGSVTRLTGVKNKIDSIYCSMSGVVKNAVDATLRQVLNYENFQKGYSLIWDQRQKHLFWEKRDWSGDELNRLLGVTVCVYCNAVKLTDSSDIKNPFDHYLDKARFPYLRLSLFNLIPSCSDCNEKRAKHLDSRTDFVKYAYPYEDSICELARFDVEPISLKGLKGRPTTKDIVVDVQRRIQTPRSLAAHKLLKGMRIDTFYQKSYLDEIGGLIGNLAKVSDQRRKSWKKRMGTDFEVGLAVALNNRTLKVELTNQEKLSALTRDVMAKMGFSV